MPLAKCAGSSEVIGAPRSMKMGNIVSPWRYDVGACHALQSVSLCQPANFCYASWAAVFPISEGGPVNPSIAAMPINPKERRARSA